MYVHIYILYIHKQLDPYDFLKSVYFIYTRLYSVLKSFLGELNFYFQYDSIDPLFSVSEHIAFTAIPLK